MNEFLKNNKGLNKIYVFFCHKLFKALAIDSMWLFALYAMSFIQFNLNAHL